MSTKKSKLPTLRQQLRDKAEERLQELIIEALDAINRVSMPHAIGGPSLAKLISGGEQKTHRHMLVTHLANNAEAELVKLWNNQQELDIGDSNDD